MNIAIYSRKSKFTGKGESIGNQIDLCSDYAKVHFDDPNFMIYEDEGFSGGNTDRPRFQQLLRDAKDHKFDVLICYRLDRVSRNIADFATLIDRLQTYNIGFVSLKEQFDTTTPMGRAMMNISSVFAQLERETIAERVRDNMLQLAKTGRWLGGITPTGYASQEVCMSVDGKERRLYKLVDVPEELDLVTTIFNKFIELRSLTKLETYLIQNDIKTKNGKKYCLAAIKIILSNPVYCTADEVAYDYLIKKECLVSAQKETFTGNFGLMPYNRTKQSAKASIQPNPCEEWIVSIGAHSPLIPSVKWIEVQTILDMNKDKSFRKVRSQEALLSGLVKCKQCGSYMRPKQSRLSADGTKMHYYYMCELKEKSKRTKCDMKNIAGHTLDHSVLDSLCQLSNTDSDLFRTIAKDKSGLSFRQNDIDIDIKKYSAKIQDLEKSIQNLLANLSQSGNNIANQYIIKQIDDLGSEIKSIESKIEKLKSTSENLSNSNLNLEIMIHALLDFKTNLENASIDKKRDLVRLLVESIIWDGTDAHVNIFGANTIKKQ